MGGSYRNWGGGPMEVRGLYNSGRGSCFSGGPISMWGGHVTKERAPIAIQGGGGRAAKSKDPIGTAVLYRNGRGHIVTGGGVLSRWGGAVTHRAPFRGFGAAPGGWGATRAPVGTHPGPRIPVPPPRGFRPDPTAAAGRRGARFPPSTCRGRRHHRHHVRGARERRRSHVRKRRGGGRSLGGRRGRGQAHVAAPPPPHAHVRIHLA